jgi:hypothetical protein
MWTVGDMTIVDGWIHDDGIDGWIPGSHVIREKFRVGDPTVGLWEPVGPHFDMVSEPGIRDKGHFPDAPNTRSNTILVDWWTRTTVSDIPTDDYNWDVVTFAFPDHIREYVILGQDDGWGIVS